MGSARYPSSAWQSMRAPSLEDFEALAIGAWEKLPEELKRLCHDVTLRVMDFPGDEMIEELDLETPFDLLGFFDDADPSTPLETHESSLDQGSINPGTFTVFRRPILDYWCEHEEMLGDVVAQVMLHEVGEHFGWSDDELEALEARA